MTCGDGFFGPLLYATHWNGIFAEFSRPKTKKTHHSYKAKWKNMKMEMLMPHSYKLNIAGHGEFIFQLIMQESG